MQIVSVRMCKKRPFLKRLKIIFPVVLGLTVLFASPCWCQSSGSSTAQQRSYERPKVHRNQRSSKQYNADKQGANQSRVRGTSSPGSNQHHRDKARQWEKLSPQQQQELHHRMDKFKSLPPEDRELYQKRYEQLQQLSPQERNDVRNKLRRMERLSPEEKEEIRRKFEQ